MTYSLLIADDEPIIAQRMYEVFSQWDIFETHCFFDGVHALEFARSSPVHIALLDICMPVLDGMHLMHELKQLHPDIHIIFLTGHRNFEYAYESLEQDNVKYVLKSDGEDKIRQTVLTCVKSLDAQRQQKEVLQKSRDLIQKLTPQILSTYFSQLLTDTAAGETADFLLTQQNISGNDSYFLLLCAICSNISFEQKIQPYYHLMHLVDQIIAAEHITFQAPKPYHFCVAVKSSADSNGNLTALLEQVQNLFYKMYGQSFSVLLSQEPVRIEQFSTCYYTLEQEFERRPNMELLLSVPVDPLANIDYTIQEISHFEISGLREKLLYGTDEEFAHCSLELLTAIDLSAQKAEIISSVLSKLVPLCLEVENSGSAPILENFSLENANSSTVTNLLARLGQAIQEKRHSSFCETSLQVVKDTDEYIHSHLNESLSLEVLAKRVFLNPSYFSRLYKQITGANLSDYITEQRISFAKKALAKTDKKISAIAAAIGFDSSSYFTVFFKKHTGISPSEYREKNSATHAF